MESCIGMHFRYQLIHLLPDCDYSPPEAELAGVFYPLGYWRLRIANSLRRSSPTNAHRLTCRRYAISSVSISPASSLIFAKDVVCMTLWHVKPNGTLRPTCPWEPLVGAINHDSRVCLTSSCSRRQSHCQQHFESNGRPTPNLLTIMLGEICKG